MSDIYLWIDDERNEPNGWLRVSDCESAITAIQIYSSNLKAISFDYDIGMKGNGEDVARFVQQKASANGIGPAVCFNIHSENPPGVKKIRSILEEIYIFWGKDPTWILEKSAKEMWKNSDL